MLNPDGVSNGYYRTNSRGKDLNRYYHDCNFEEFPENYAVCELAKYLKSDKQQNFFGFVDFHAHNSKQGIVLY
jgi:murein tripeptide amidase MpaA